MASYCGKGSAIGPAHADRLVDERTDDHRARDRHVPAQVARATALLVDLGSATPRHRPDHRVTPPTCPPRAALDAISAAWPTPTPSTPQALAESRALT
jgi:hypothetical protein